jgi:predicted dehydrogenase
MMASGRLDVAPLISHRFDFADYEEAYEIIEKGQQRYLGILLQYGAGNDANGSSIALSAKSIKGPLGIGLLGAGNFAKMVLIPALKAVASRVRLRAICSAGGVSATMVGRKHGFEVATTDEDDVIGDDEVAVVFVLTRHDEHYRQVIKAIDAGKHVFVEKPLCLNCDQFQAIENAILSKGRDTPVIMVGFNRRFSPAAELVRKFVDSQGGPRTISIRFNAGPIPLDHWTQDDSVGGGRIIGEACHGIDLATYLAGAEVVKVYAESTEDGLAHTDDQCHIVMRHANGSISCVTYVSTGDRSFPKERVEVFAGGAVAIIDDFRTVSTYCGGRSKRQTIRPQDKGHKNEIAAFLDSITNGRSVPIPWTELRATTRASFLAVKSLREGIPFDV